MAFARKRFRRRSARPRTRWFAVTPGGLALMASGTNYFQQMNLETEGGAVNMSTLVGGTVLRSLIDLVWQPEWSYDATALVTVSQIFNMGLFVDQSTAPSTTMWDSNKPYGSFMTREQRSIWFTRLSNGNMGSVNQDLSGLHVHIDTAIRRRLSEGDRLWMHLKQFSLSSQNGNLDTMSVGWTGRVLVQLP